jgi:CBS domain-containing protein
VTTARDIMHRGAECVGERETLSDAAKKMREMGVGALPICGTDDRLKGIITDRDIVLECIARDQDPREVTAGQLAQGTPVTVNADAEVNEVLDQMIGSGIRRIPVIEEHRLVGMISEADLARNLPQDQVAHFVEAITSQP